MRLPPALAAFIERTANRVSALPPVRVGRDVLDAYGRAGGGLLAGGLTYAALFAILPALLLLTGVLGFVVDDPERRAAIVEGIGSALPPLRGLIDTSLVQIAQGAAGAGTVGLIGLAWGASRFYGSLDDAFAHIFETARPRGFVSRTVRGLLSVVLFVGTVVLSLALTAVVSYLASQTESRLGNLPTGAWQVASGGLAAAIFVVVTAVLYRIVPARPVPWRALALPAVLAGLALAVLTQIFSYIAPRLIGTAAVYGTFVAIFAVMVWLSTAFQLLLIGAAWVAVRSGRLDGVDAGEGAGPGQP